jgi:hypothetical protein
MAQQEDDVCRPGRIDGMRVCLILSEMTASEVE